MDFDNSFDIITPDIQQYLTVGGTGGLVVPSGTIAQRAGGDGTIRFNTDIGLPETYVSSSFMTYQLSPSLSSVSVSAAGTTYSTATPLTSDYNLISFATAGSATGVSLPSLPMTQLVGRRVFVYNDTSVSLSVYPQTGGSIDGQTANSPATLPAGDTLELIQLDTTRWATVMNTGAATSGSTFTNFLSRYAFDTGNTSNNWYAPMFYTWTSANSTPSGANRLYAWPIFIQFATSIDAICFKLGTAGTTMSLDMGIYSPSSTGFPGSLMLGWNSYGVTASIVNVLPFTSATSGAWAKSAQVIPAGWYWMAVNHASTFQYTRVMTSNNMMPFTNGDVGLATACMYAAYTYGNLPTTYPSTVSYVPFSGTSNDYNLPGILFRRGG